MKIFVVIVSAVIGLGHFLVLVYYLDYEYWIMNNQSNDQ